MNPTPLSHTRAAVTAGVRQKRIWRYFIFGAALGGVFLYLAVRHMDWKAVGQTLAQTEIAFLPAAFVIFTGSFFLRAIRWRIVLTAGTPLSRSQVFWANMVGYVGNSFLPARAGELIRSALIAGRTQLSKSFVLATALTERMLDSLALVMITAVALSGSRGMPDWLHHTSKVVGIIGGFGLIAVMVLPQFGTHLVWALHRLPLPASFREGLAHMLEQGLRGMGSFRHPARGLGFLGLTVAVWLADATVAMVVARALHIEMSLPSALVLLAALGLSSALPSTPGYIGIYQFVAITVLPPFGISRSNALAFIVMFQLLTYVVVSVWGLLGIWHLNAGAPKRFPPEVIYHPVQAKANAATGAEAR